MINTQLALIRRELWEHRSIYVVPAVLALVVTLTSITGQVAVSSFSQQIDLAIIGASNLGDNERSAAINVLMIAVSWVFVLTMLFLIFFYALDALYAERKDKSILFWRSLPVTDAETVVSKLATAAIVIPLVTLAAIATTHLLVLTISSIWVGMRGASGWGLVWGAAPLLENWLATLIVIVALSIWTAPFVGWFLFVSAFAKRSPYLLATLPLVVVPMLERLLLGSTVFARTLLARMPFQAPIVREFTADDFHIENGDEILALAESGVSLLSLIDVVRFLGSPAVWLGLVVCGLFCTAAIYVRRYRDES
jgi:ABC-2 type transport system permease protein